MSNSNPQGKDKPEEKKWWTKTKVRIVTITSILVLVGLVLELPKKIYDTYELILGEELISTPLRGRVMNNLGNPIKGAILKIDELPGDSVIATSDGGFYFAEVPGKPGDRIRLYIISPSHHSHNEYVTLPGPITIELNE